MNKKEDGYNSNSIFWHKGEGMDRRCHNINKIKELIQNGYTYQQIFRIARKYFTSKIFNEYYDIAIDEVNNPIEDFEESFTEKVKKGKIKPRKDVPDS